MERKEKERTSSRGSVRCAVHPLAQSDSLRGGSNRRAGEP